MKTKEVLDKYRKILSGLLGSDYKPEDIRFFKSCKDSYFGITTSLDRLPKSFTEIGSFEYEDKPEDEHNVINWSEGTYAVYAKETVLSTFKLYRMPHCCGILISCNAFVNKEFRGKRVGTTLNMLRQDIGRVLGYSLLMCTDISQNAPQRKLLATNGWTDLKSFKNKRTGNTVFVSSINL